MRFWPSCKPLHLVASILIALLLNTLALPQMLLLGVGPAGSSGPVPAFTAQLYSTNTNANIGVDTCAGFFATATNTCKFFPTFGFLVGDGVVVGFSAQTAATIVAAQSLSVVDSAGNVWIHPGANACRTFFSTSRVNDCMISIITVASATPEIDITIATPPSGGERIGAFMAVFHPSANVAIFDSVGTINDSVSCGTTGIECSGVPFANYSPAWTGTNDGCVVFLIAGAGQQSAAPLSPWSIYGNNGDHAAQTVGVGITPGSYVTPLFTSTATAQGAATAVCFYHV